ncbi:MAG TPA: M1 family aminopeptidase [Planctomycetota bacterium]
MGAFDVVEDEYEGETVKVPVTYYVPSGWHTEEEIRNTFRRTPEMIRFFSERTGVPYPYAKYAQVVVEDFTWGGMENISATTLHPGTVVKKRSWVDRDSEGLIAHELAHQWFGDLVTCRTWGHAWLNEGFATYMEALWQESVGGREALVADLQDAANWYFGECKNEYMRPTACDYYTWPDDVFDAHIYPKGAWILHMLRSELGDDLWWKGIKHYLTKHRAGIVATDDFRIAMEEASGRDLKAFFDQWLFKAGHPAFKVTATFEPVPGRVTMTVEQTQPARKLVWKDLQTEQPVFRVPIDVEIETESGRKTHRIEVKERTQTFTFDVDGIPEIIDFDRDGSILKTFEFARTPAELMRQLERDDQAWHRWWAARELSGKAEATATLTNALAHDGSFRVRIAAAESLGEIKSLEARRALVAALRQPATLVRVAVLKALANHAEEAAEALAATFEKDASPACRAAAATSLGKRKKPVDLFSGYAQYLGDEVVFPGILAGMAEAQHPATMNACLKATEYGVHPVIRTRATELLGDLLKKKWDVRGRKRILELLDDPNFRVRRAVIAKMSLLRDSTFPDALEKRLAKETEKRMVKDIQDAIRKIRALLKP